MTSPDLITITECRALISALRGRVRQVQGATASSRFPEDAANDLLRCVALVVESRATPSSALGALASAETALAGALGCVLGGSPRRVSAPLGSAEQALGQALEAVDEEIDRAMRAEVCSA